ncbi:hypothetical protein FOA52_000796 [Chlamydomonas sp. UWO 241]|nr:hypothetical protein FOA52_000796 [Chlamydomonas sp. UWO 241]
MTYDQLARHGCSRHARFGRRATGFGCSLVAAYRRLSGVSIQAKKSRGRECSPASTNGAQQLCILASDPVPPGYYLASCEGASEASATVLALTLYRDICAVVGGTVRGPTVASPYAVPTAAIECVSTGGESSAPPHAVTCRIVTLPDDDSADLPPPPLPRAAPPPLSLTDLIVVRRPAPRQPAPPPQRSLRQPQHGVSGGGGGGGRAPPAPTHGGADDDGALLPPLELPDGYRAITCREALVHMAAIVELLQPGDMCRVGDGSLVQHGETVSSACPDPREPEDRTYSCVIGVRGAAPPPPMHNTEPLSPLPEALLVALEGTAAVKAWRLGRGFLVYVGAGVVPEAAVFPMASDRPDRAVWRQLMLSIAHIVEQAEDEE